MILYYSSTGNTEYIAKEVAKRLDDESIIKPTFLLSKLIIN